MPRRQKYARHFKCGAGGVTIRLSFETDDGLNLIRTTRRLTRLWPHRTLRQSEVVDGWIVVAPRNLGSIHRPEVVGSITPAQKGP